MKRSAALLVMATASVGAGAYALTPRDDCTGGNAPGVVSPQVAGSSCGSGSSSRGGSGSGSRSIWGGGSRGTDISSGTSASSGTERGGFGGFARSIGSHLASFGG